jgi:hypothetical protein
MKPATQHPTRNVRQFLPAPQDYDHYKEFGGGPYPTALIPVVLRQKYRRIDFDL